MTQSASVDRDQLAVLRRLREHGLAPEVLAVLDPGSVAYLNAQTWLVQQAAGIAVAPVAASILERTSDQQTLIEE